VDVIAFRIDERLEDWRLGGRRREVAADVVVVVVIRIERCGGRVGGRRSLVVVRISSSKWSSLP
jgi:hypothetical protein